MRKHPDDALRRWLEAEEAGRQEAAEAALGELFAGVGRALPPAGFAERVMVAAGFPPLPVPIPVAVEGGALRWPLRVALAACLALVGLVVPVLPLLATWVGSLTGRLSPGAALDAVTTMLVGVAHWLAEGLGFWQGLARFGGWCADLVAAPSMAALLLVVLVATAGALRLLADLIAHERSWTYVRSN